MCHTELKLIQFFFYEMHFHLIFFDWSFQKCVYYLLIMLIKSEGMFLNCFSTSQPNLQSHLILTVPRIKSRSLQFFTPNCQFLCMLFIVLKHMIFKLLVSLMLFLFKIALKLFEINIFPGEKTTLVSSNFLTKFI